MKEQDLKKIVEKELLYLLQRVDTMNLYVSNIAEMIPNAKVLSPTPDSNKRLKSKP